MERLDMGRIELGTRELQLDDDRGEATIEGLDQSIPAPTNTIDQDQDMENPNSFTVAVNTNNIHDLMLQGVDSFMVTEDPTGLEELENYFCETVEANYQDKVENRADDDDNELEIIYDDGGQGSSDRSNHGLQQQVKPSTRTKCSFTKELEFVKKSTRESHVKDQPSGPPVVEEGAQAFYDKNEVHWMSDNVNFGVESRILAEMCKVLYDSQRSQTSKKRSKCVNLKSNKSELSKAKAKEIATSILGKWNINKNLKRKHLFDQPSETLQRMKSEEEEHALKMAAQKDKLMNLASFYEEDGIFASLLDGSCRSVKDVKSIKSVINQHQSQSPSANSASSTTNPQGPENVEEPVAVSSSSSSSSASSSTSSDSSDNDMSDEDDFSQVSSTCSSGETLSNDDCDENKVRIAHSGSESSGSVAKLLSGKKYCEGSTENRIDGSPLRLANDERLMVGAKEGKAKATKILVEASQNPDHESNCAMTSEMDHENANLVKVAKITPSEKDNEELREGGSSQMQEKENQKPHSYGENSAEMKGPYKVLESFIKSTHRHPKLNEHESEKLLNENRKIFSAKKLMPIVVSRPTPEEISRYVSKFGGTEEKFLDLFNATNPSLGMSEHYNQVRAPESVNGLRPGFVPLKLAESSLLMQCYLKSALNEEEITGVREVSGKEPEEGILWNPTNLNQVPKIGNRGKSGKTSGTSGRRRKPRLDPNDDDMVLKVQFYEPQKKAVADLPPSKRNQGLHAFKLQKSDFDWVQSQEAVVSDVAMAKLLANVVEKRQKKMRMSNNGVPTEGTCLSEMEEDQEGMDEPKKKPRIRKRRRRMPREKLLLDVELLLSSTVTVAHLCNLFQSKHDVISPPLNWEESLASFRTSSGKLQLETQKDTPLLFLHIGNTIFCDIDNPDVAQAANQLLDEMNSQRMKKNCGTEKFALQSWNVCLSSLNARFGYPYMLTQHGSCNHIVVMFRNCRAPDPGEVEILQKSPRIVHAAEISVKFCLTHHDSIARYLAVCERQDYTKTRYYCTSCAIRVALILKALKENLIGPGNMSSQQPLPGVPGTSQSMLNSSQATAAGNRNNQLLPPELCISFEKYRGFTLHRIDVPNLSGKPNLKKN